MTESEAIKKAIRHFECVKNDAVVVLDSGFGTHPGESNIFYRNRKIYAELAIQALEKQIPKKLIRRRATDDDVENELRDFITCKGEICRCPACGDCIAIYELKYCMECGQRLDLGTESE